MTMLTAPSRFFTEEQEMFREQVRNFVHKEVNPHIEQWEQEQIFPKSLYRRMGELGFLGIRYPEKYGGSDGDIWMTVAFCEELCRCRALGLPMSVLVHTDMSSTHIGQESLLSLRAIFSTDESLRSAIQMTGWRPPR